ncbi:MAG: type II toxin-antitoxin system VapC family toxin [Promethearchaeota archaeon]
MKHYIVDASVIVKWFIDENDSEKAEILREAFVKKKVEIICPSLLQFEVLNALKYSNLFNKDDLVIAAEALEAYPFTVQQIKGKIQERMISLALDHDLSIHDAAYVSLAIEGNKQLVTADEKIKEKLPEKLKDHVIPLSATF